jgi:DNA-binding transcriptional ArsR family regulator
LKEAGLVEGRKEGHWIHYRAREEALTELKELVGAL